MESWINFVKSFWSNWNDKFDWKVKGKFVELKMLQKCILQRYQNANWGDVHLWCYYVKISMHHIGKLEWRNGKNCKNFQKIKWKWRILQMEHHQMTTPLTFLQFRMDYILMLQFRKNKNVSCIFVKCNFFIQVTLTQCPKIKN